jgi:ABC-type molybdenum transport system ATPase subunit/photorepair protein PhrA
MAKYEIWGDDGSGESVLLAYVNGEVPAGGDTILVRGQVREIEKAFKHHVGPQITHRVKVGPPIGSG